MPRRSTAPNVETREGRNNRVLIGKRITERRLAIGMSQASLANEFGVGRATLSHYEAGLGDLNAGDMNFLAHILGVPVSYFFLEDGDDGSRQRLIQLEAYFPLLPELHQDIIMNTVFDTYARIFGNKTEIEREATREAETRWQNSVQRDWNN